MSHGARPRITLGACSVNLGVKSHGRVSKHEADVSRAKARSEWREYAEHSVRLLSIVCALATYCLVPTLGWAQSGAVIADDAELFSVGLRAEFREMNDTFAELGFEIEVLHGEQPTLGVIITKYGDPDRSDDVEVVLGYGANERAATLTFHYYGDVGFGVLPGDSEQLVVRVKRREG